MRTPLYNFAGADVTGVTDNYFDVVLTLSNVTDSMADLLSAFDPFDTKAHPPIMMVQGMAWEEFLLSAVTSPTQVTLSRLAFDNVQSFSAGARIELRASADLLSRFVEQQSPKGKLYNDMVNPSLGLGNLLLGPILPGSANSALDEPFYVLETPTVDNTGNYILGQLLSSTTISGRPFARNQGMGSRLSMAGSDNVAIGYNSTARGYQNTIVGNGSGDSSTREGVTAVGADSGVAPFDFTTSLGHSARPKMPRHAAIAGVPYFDAPDDALGLNTGTFRGHISAVTQIMGSRVRPSPTAGRYSTIDFEDTYWVAVQEVTLFIGTMPNNEPTALTLDVGLVDAPASTTNFRSLLRAPLEIGPLNTTDHSGKGYFNFPIPEGVCQTGQYLCFWLNAGTIDFRIYPYVRLMLGKT